MKRFIPAAIIVAGVLALASIAVVQLSGADANDDIQAPRPLNQPLPPSIVIDAPTEERASANQIPQVSRKGAYVGIVLAELTEDEADALGIEGGAAVKSVRLDSPADGLLEDEDIITSIDGEPISGPGDVVDTVMSSSPEDVMTFTVLRDGDTVNVEVTLGERETVAFAFRLHDFTLGRDQTRPFHGMRDGVIKSEVVTETDDGFQTTRTVVGTVENIDVEAGAFDLMPVDGTDAIHFEIDAETRVVINHDGDISGLNSEERTLVVEVETSDGDRIVKLVSQGQGPGHLGPRGHFGQKRHFGSRAFGRRGSHFSGSHDGLSFELRPGRLPNIREHLRSFLSDETLEDLRERGFEFERFFDRFPREADDSQ